MVKDGVRLHAQARLLSDPPLWCWEIVDASDGVVVASSWQSEWTAYPSPGEALREAAPVLVRLTRRGRLDGAGVVVARREGRSATRAVLHS